MQAQPLLEAMVRRVLLGPRCHGLIWHPALLDALLHRFLSHDFNAASVRRGLQVLYLLFVTTLRKATHEYHLSTTACWCMQG